MLEATFLGLWIFGWNRLSPRVHLATIWIAVAGTWMSAYFILVANSFMQDPQGYNVVNGEAQLTSVWELLSTKWSIYAFVHTILAGLTAGAAVVFGICCWHFARPAECRALQAGGEAGADSLWCRSPSFNLWFGSHFGILVTELQPMKIAASEAQWDTCSNCSFSLFQIGGFTEDDQTPSFSIEIPDMLSFLATGSLPRHGAGPERPQPAVQAAVRARERPVAELPAAGRGRLLEHARHGVRGLAHGAGGHRRRAALLAAQARAVGCGSCWVGAFADVPAARRNDVRAGC